MASIDGNYTRLTGMVCGIICRENQIINLDHVNSFDLSLARIKKGTVVKTFMINAVDKITVDPFEPAILLCIFDDALGPNLNTLCVRISDAFPLSKSHINNI